MNTTHAPVPSEAGTDSDDPEYDAITILEKEAKATPREWTAPRTLQLAQIEVMPEVFQPRDIDDYHLRDLARVPKAGKSLDPVLLIRIGDRFIVVDGHHRIEAYKRADWTKPVPVEWFGGSVEAAVLESRQRLAKPQKPMSNTERMNAAWWLIQQRTTDGRYRYSRRQVQDATGASSGTTRNMRRVLKTLERKGAKTDVKWWMACMMADDGKVPEIEEQSTDALVQEYADRLRFAFSNMPIKDPNVIARAHAMYYGSLLRSVLPMEMNILVLGRDPLYCIDHFSEETSNDPELVASLIAMLLKSLDPQDLDTITRYWRLHGLSDFDWDPMLRRCLKPPF